jgi:sirohydrochlorin cobaltochelatase
MTQTSHIGKIIFAHGSRDPLWRLPFEDILRKLQALSDSPASLAFLECMTPTLEQAIDEMVAAGINQIVVIPAFLAVGSHVRKDLPILLDSARAKHPHLSLHASSAVGEQGAIQEAIASFALAAR